MTNPDTSTLNGALEQLGITMADNLVTMGVSDADPSDGLTTLAGKILDIGPTPPTPTPASITLTADKSILSYADTESAVLTATVLDSSSNPVEGVSVDLYKDSVLWDTLTTGSAGTVSKTYTSAGIGDVGFTAECGSLVTETYSIHDYWYYSTTEYSTPSDAGTAINVDLPSAFQLEFDITPTSRSTSSWGSASYLKIGTDGNNGLWLGQLTSAGRHGIMPKPSGTTQYCTSDTVLNTDNHITIVYQNGTATYTLNGESVSVSASNLSKIVTANPVPNNHLKNIKVSKL